MRTPTVTAKTPSLQSGPPLEDAAVRGRMFKVLALREWSSVTAIAMVVSDAEVEEIEMQIAHNPVF